MRRRGREDRQDDVWEGSRAIVAAVVVIGVVVFLIILLAERG
jgi:hypothetical protein